MRVGNAYVVRFAHGFPKRLKLSVHHLRDGDLTLILPQAPLGATVRDERPAASPVRYERRRAGLVLHFAHAVRSDALTPLVTVES